MFNSGGGGFSAPNINLGTEQTVVRGSTDGQATFTQPLSGMSDKEVLVYLDNLVGDVSYTFPTPFTYTPAILQTLPAISATIKSISTTDVTIIGLSDTGWIIIKGF